LLVGVLVLEGAVGGQPDVLKSVDVTALHDIAERHLTGADSTSLLLQRNTAAPSSVIKTIVGVEHTNNSLESSHTTASTLHASLPQQPVDTSAVPVRYYLISSKITF